VEKVNDTTYKDVDATSGVEVVVGDEKQADFYPRTKLKKWSNEANISIGVEGSTGKEGLSLDGDKLIWGGDQTANFYPLRKTDLPSPTSIRWLNFETMDPISAAAEYELFRTGHGHDSFAIATYRVDTPSIMLFGSIPAERYVKLRATTSQDVQATEVESGSTFSLPSNSNITVEVTEEERLTASLNGSQYYVERSSWRHLKNVRVIDFDHEDKSAYLADDMSFPTFEDVPAVRIWSPNANPYYMDENLINVDIHYGQYQINGLDEKWTSSIIEVLEDLGVPTIRVSTRPNKIYFEHNGRQVKFHSAENARGILACYINIDCDYNKNYDFYRPDVDRQSDVRDNYAYGIKRAYPFIDFSIVPLIVSRFASKLGVTLDERPYSDAELNKWDKLKLKHDNFDWVDDCKRDDAGWHYSNEENGFEFEVELTEPPVSLSVPFSVQAKNCKFLYQGRLSRTERLMGAERFPHVEGSYAIYRNDDKFEKSLSKLCHIYRPIAIDKNGDKYFCDIRIDSTSQVGEDFFATVSAVLPEQLENVDLYPIILDPTLGYTSIGGTEHNTHNIVSGIIVTTGTGSGPLQHMDVYLKADAANNKYAYGVYTSSNNTLLANTPNHTAAAAEAAAWRRLYFNDANVVKASENTAGSSNPTVTNQTYTSGGGDSVREWTPGELANLKTATGDNDFCRPNTSLTNTNPNTDWLQLNDFGFSIPTTAEVSGVKVRFNVNSGAADNTKAAAVRITLDGNNLEKTTDTGYWPSGDASGSNRDWISYGGKFDNWGDYTVPSVPNNLTPANVNSSGFAVAMRATKAGSGGSNRAHRVFEADVTVYYHDESSSDLQSSTAYKIAAWGNNVDYSLVKLYYDTDTDPGDEGFQYASTYSDSTWPNTISPTLEDRLYSMTVSYRTEAHNVAHSESSGTNDLVGPPELSRIDVDNLGAAESVEQLGAATISKADFAGAAESTSLLGAAAISKEDSSGTAESTALLGAAAIQKEDSAGSVDVEALLAEFGFTQADSSGSADALGTLNLGLSKSDNSGAAEDVPAQGLGVSLSDNSGALDVAPKMALDIIAKAIAGALDTRSIVAGVTTADNAGSLDEISKAIALELADSSGANDIISAQAALNIVNNLGSSDLLQGLVQLNVADNSGSLDERSTNLGLSLLDASGLNDAISKVTGHQTSIVDEVGALDALLLTVTNAITDILGSADAVTVSSGVFEEITKEDIAAITDAISVAVTQTIIDVIGASDIDSKLAEHDIVTSDSLGLKDAIFSGLAVERIDSLGTLDNRTLGIARTIIDTAGFLDSVARQVGVSAVASLGASDASLLETALSFIDTAGGLDSVEAQKGLVVAIADALGASDDLVQRHIGLIQTDIAGLLDAEVIDVPTTFKLALFIKEALTTAKFMEETLNQDAKINFTSESLKFVQFMSEVFKGEGE